MKYFSIYYYYNVSVYDDVDACQKRAKNRIVAYHRCTSSASEINNDELIFFSDNNECIAMTREQICMAKNHCMQ